MTIIKRWTDEVSEVTCARLAVPEAAIMTWGATVRDLQVRLKDGALQRVVLGFDSFEPYPAHSPISDRSPDASPSHLRRQLHA